MFFKLIGKTAVIMFFLSVVAAGCTKDVQETVKVEKITDPCLRIISTAPSITETLFELGYGDRIIGVTDDCVFPEVEEVDRIGRVLNVNIEKVLSLKPDVVMVIDANQELKERIEALGIKVVSFDHSTIRGFIDSIPKIVSVCDLEKDSSKFVKKYEKVLDPVIKTEKKQRVMLVVGRDYFSDSVKDVYLAGSDGFYSEMITAVGLENVYKGDFNYPKVQVEGIVSMNPDIIVDVITTKNLKQKDKKRLKTVWKKLKDVKAVKNNKVFIVDKNYWSIPGPRFVNIIEELNAMVNADD